MKRFSTIFIAVIVMASSTSFFAQDAVIELRNPSFEDTPHAGGLSILGIKGWYDCGLRDFPTQTPPDIHPAVDTTFWKNPIKANDGKTYLGMVVRENDSYEAVSQRLTSPLQEGMCYEFSIDLARSNLFLSGTNTSDSESYTTPTVLRIWGGIKSCQTSQLLAETVAVKHSDWRRYDLKIRPNFIVTAITLQAYYKTPVLDPYNGHILVDNASPIRQVPCPGEEIAVVEKPKKVVPPHMRRKKKPTPKPVNEIVEVKTKKKILKDLDRKKIFKGQKINIDNLYFTADASVIREESFEVLDEVVDFLKENRDVKIEIGGHTNNTPKHEYCDALSRVRAKEVAKYLNEKGIEGRRLQFKGYGKRKPVASNNTKKGRKRNQRVEIKILSFDS